MFAASTLVSIICLTCLLGVFLHYKKDQLEVSRFVAKSLIGATSGFFVIVAAVVIATIFNLSPVYAAETAMQAGTMPNAYGLGFLGAGLSVGLACIGTGIATGMAASAAIGAVSENPKMLGTSLLFVGLSEGIAIYGLIIAIMILGRLA